MTRRIKDISERLGLSVSTVSKALNDYPDVAPRTRLLVQQTARELGYQPSASARNLRRGRTEKLGLLINHSLHYISEYFAEVMAGIAMTAEQNGTNVILYTETVHQPDGLLRICRSGEIDGALLLWANPSDGILQHLEKERMPYVVVGRRVELASASYVTPDNREGAQRLTQHLIEQGHRRIGFMARPVHGLTNEDRLAGYVDAHAQAGLSLDSRLIMTTELEPESGYHAMQRLMELPQPPTAVFAFYDLMAVDALRAAHERGLRVPHDVAIVGFDGLPSSQITTPRLTTVRQPLRAMGRKAVEILLSRIAQPDMPAIQLTFPIELVVRDSSQP